MGDFGLSYIGLIALLVLFIPNVLWARNKPEGYDALAKQENKNLMILERVGQILTTTFVLVFRNFNIATLNSWSWWLVAAFILLALYVACWIRYFTKGKTLELFYGDFLGIPVPLATLPVAAFILLGIYGKVLWMIVAALILGIGHIGIHLQHRRTLNREEGIS